MHLFTSCSGLSRCLVPVNSVTFPDSCPNTSKYLEVHYSCQRHTQHAQTLPQLWNINNKILDIEKVLQHLEDDDSGDENYDNIERVPITASSETVVTTTITPSTTTEATTSSLVKSTVPPTSTASSSANPTSDNTAPSDSEGINMTGLRKSGVK